MLRQTANQADKTQRRFHIILLSILLVAPLTVAATCFNRSPLSPPGADPHTAIEPNQLSDTQQRSIEALFKSLRGRWQGQALGYFCKGTEESPNKVADNASVELEVESYDRGSVTIKAVLTATDRRSSRNELIKLILSNDTLRIGRDTRAGETRVSSASRSELAFAIKEARARSNVVGGFGEVHRGIHVSRNQLTIEFVVYSRGGLSSTSRWTMRRR